MSRWRRKTGDNKVKNDENSGHYIIASSRPPERRPLERRTLVPIGYSPNHTLVNIKKCFPSFYIYGTWRTLVNIGAWGSLILQSQGYYSQDCQWSSSLDQRAMISPPVVTVDTGRCISLLKGWLGCFQRLLGSLLQFTFAHLQQILGKALNFPS